MQSGVVCCCFVLLGAEQMVLTSGRCVVISGLGEIAIEVTGKTVRFVRDALRSILNIPDASRAFVNGEAVDDGYILGCEESITFMKASGEKGLGELLTPNELMARWQIDESHYRELVSNGLPSHWFHDGTVRHPEVAVDDWLRRYFEPSDLLTEDEAIRRLRLDTINIANPAETLRRYRDKGLLRATQVSKRLFYRASEIDRFLTMLTESNPR